MLNHKIPRVVISALRGSSGKTLLSLSLVSLWREQGLHVTPFKKGPDYIDAGWLSRAAGGPCFNLDLFMMKPQEVLHSFISHTQTPISLGFTNEDENITLPLIPSRQGRGGEWNRSYPCDVDNIKFPLPLRERVRGRGTKQPANIAVIEGNRGLYDSIDPKGAYSTARLAKLLKAPVIIVVDCSKVTTTLSAMILGCQKLDPEVSIKGVVLNNVANPRQESVIRRAIKRNCGLPVVGAFPVLKKDLFPERHMGLTPSQEHREVEKALSTIIEMGEKYLDLKAIWKIAKSAPPLEDSNELRGTSCEPQNSKLKTQNLKLDSPLKVGVIIDSAFQFYYPENLEELKRGGAELITINALKDKRLPKIDALYIGGGFPETHAKELAQNRSLRKDLHEAVERGLSVYAECGGLMYLGESLILNNKTYPMVGALPLVFAVEKKPQAHGYTIVKVERENSYFRKGAVLKGHEFHYSHVISSTNPRSPIPNPRLFNPQPLMPNPPIRFAFKMKRGKGIMDGMDGICYKNVLATYTHLHAHGVKEWAKGIIRCARKFSVVARQS